ncbi:hypothetical protein DM01DRAFT_1410182 [Hesseltinella vesiculosa]|uniref:DDHD domain-containing protein n=1 Tax=Hesseltinella vesiculosa TaxID=101127 RepID=A0A1X2G817_9FUNG|nr:hypothetical protein DM01DRAFT_1410182 [Hesseltinella vesiculosa]
MYDSYSADLPDHSVNASCQGQEEIHSVWDQEDCDIDHVIFVIHGIGQQTERFGYFEQHMETLRDTICEILQAKTPDRDLRIQLIPIEWHKHIHEQTDSTLSNVTLDNIPGMRLISNDYIMDALYYLSHDRQQCIIDHVVGAFNETYQEFIDDHPTFHGNIGIFGYSLGGLVSWDILSHQRPLHTKEERAQVEKLNLNMPRLAFEPQFLFGVGCPLGALLNIRNQDPRLYHPDSSVTFQNLYHPCDPLAYRVEPLYHPDCRHHTSVQVPVAMPNNRRRSSLQCLAGWLTSWFSNQEGTDDQDPQPSRRRSQPLDPELMSVMEEEDDLDDDDAFDDYPAVDHLHLNYDSPSFNDPCLEDAPTSWLNPTSPPPSASDAATPPCQHPFEQLDTPAFPLDITHAETPLPTFELPATSDESTDVLNDDSDNLHQRRSSLGSNNIFSSVGALFQYISPRASFDRDSAFGSDIEDHDDDALEIKRPSTSAAASAASVPHQKIRPRSAADASTLLTPPHMAVPVHDPTILYRRRQSQIYDLNPSGSASSFWAQKKRRQSLPNLHQAMRESTTLEDDPVLLQSLPGARRVDYVLQPDPVFGGMISNSYILGLQAHFSYWNNKDMLWHIVQQLDDGFA